MALQSKIKKVAHQRQIDDGAGGTVTDDLSLRGRYFVEVDYFDDANPTNILLSQTFEFPRETTVEQAQEAIIAFGRSVRDARVRVGELQVYVGATIPIT